MKVKCEKISRTRRDGIEPVENSVVIVHKRIREAEWHMRDKILHPWLRYDRIAQLEVFSWHPLLKKKDCLSFGKKIKRSVF